MAQDESVDPVSDLLEQLGSTERALQRAARDEASARLQREPGFRETLYRLLIKGSPRARFSAAYVLFHEDRPTLRLLPTLLDLLELEDGDLRWTTANMLATLGRMQAEVYPVLLHESLRAEAPQRRRMALHVLRELAPERVETKEAFLSALKDRDSGVRRAALSSLAKLTDPDHACLNQALELARSGRDPTLQRIAVVVLPDLVAHHPEARDAVAALLEEHGNSDDLSLARTAQAAKDRLAG
jgi:HEAT repeat protein